MLLLTERVNVRIDSPTVETLKALAERERRSLSSLVVYLVSTHPMVLEFEQEKRQRKKG